MHSTKLSGAKTHNLKGLDLTLHPGQVVAITGVSGSGKSSLALDTLYAEGQRRFVESFSPYARQFLERLERPPVDELHPVPAAVAVDRAAPVKSSRSTVATMADIEPLLAALFSREAIPACPEHGVLGERHDVDSIARQLLNEHPGQRAVISYRVDVRDSAAYLEIRDELAAQGYRRAWSEGTTRSIDDLRPSEVVAAGHINVVTDRLTLGTKHLARLRQGVERAWSLGAGRSEVTLPDRDGLSRRLQSGWSCPRCARQLSAPTAGLFSYESPLGACPGCRGFGRVIGVDIDKVIPDPYKTLAQKAIRPWNGKSTTWERGQLKRFCADNGIAMDVPWVSLPAEQQKLVLDGTGRRKRSEYPGVFGWFRWLETKIYKMHVRVLLARYRSYDECPTCKGCRLNERALAYRVGGWNLAEWHRQSISNVRRRLQSTEPVTEQGRLIIEQLQSRLSYLEHVGLGYLSLARQARTLSGGEAQRVTLTAALGSSLHNALFVLDEPSVGLHASDIAPLAKAIRELAARNNTVLLIEHDPELIKTADRVIELGPGAGSRGGEVVFDGSVVKALSAGGATERAFSRSPIEPQQVSYEPEDWLHLEGVSAHNLKNVEAKFPLRCVCAVSGPSGSGKSSLVVDVLYKAMARRLGDFTVERPGPHRGLSGGERLKRVVLVDQSPLGRTSRGNAATYTKAWDPIRKAFAQEPSSRQRHFTPSHFSFNVDGGRCDACTGEGYETVEMQFLADVRLLCPVCRGQRFKPEILAVTHAGVSVAQVLESTVDEVLAIFAGNPAVVRALGPLPLLGLGYLQLGQALSTLSGGEAQRLKLARALTEKLDGTLFVVDEPSAGLHADEVQKVIDCFRTIVRAGGSVVVVEHDLEILRSADWVIDVGPDSGALGGEIVFQGSPSALVLAGTRTGQALALPFETAFKKPKAIGAHTPAVEILRAREHNLRDVSVTIPHDALTVVTGPSGSGKSSLVFDVLFAEGQRRFLETLTPYARQFLPTMPKPDVDMVVGVPPSVALEQRTSRAGANSTVATVTEMAHYLRLLFAKLGVARCPTHLLPIGSTSVGALLPRLQKVRGKFELLAPVVEARKGTYLDVFNAADRDGIVHAYADGQLVKTGEPPRLVRSREHTIDLVIRPLATLGALTELDLERALTWGGGSVKLRNAKGELLRYSLESSCPECGTSVPELDPRWFSFNTKQGQCPRCEGAGVVNAVAPRSKLRRGAKSKVKAPSAEKAEWVLCPACEGTRLHQVPRNVQLQGQTYPEYSHLSIEAFQKVLSGLRFVGDDKKIAEPIIFELSRRVEFLTQVGLGYLSLDRTARSLSGGEMQRLRLAAQLGAGLTGALYVLDEPTIGLHPRDTSKLIDNLNQLVKLGSTVVVVEHDVDMIRRADYLIDMGPGGGSTGGQVIVSGKPKTVLSHKESPTARCLSGQLQLRAPLPVERDHPRLQLTGVCIHNVHGQDAQLPVGRFNVVAGVSGSGKSSLVRGVLLPAVRERLGLVTPAPAEFEQLGELHGIRRAISVDQSPIGRTPRSVPATFLGIWDVIRRLFAQTSDAQIRGYGPARFSFNTPSGGRCPSCDGQGVITHEMSFLPDVVQTCPVCQGARFEPDTLEVRYLGLNVGQVLQLSVDEACDVFKNHPKIVAPLQTLRDLGAGYIRLGQGSHTLSGGESQRLKLADELTAGSRHEPTLYVLDEPTTGLHQADVERLVLVLDRLVQRGDTLVVIEHHPVVIAGADFVLELGPGGGEHGGRVVGSGTPRSLSRKRTPTAPIIAELLA